MKTSSYSFTAQPAPVQGGYRDGSDASHLLSNIMFDKRIVRGNTYAPRRPLINPVETLRKTQPASPAKSKTGKVVQDNPLERVPTPEPVPGREHRAMQTDRYVEDLRHQSTKVDRIDQTEAELDYPMPPLPMLLLDRAYRSERSTDIGPTDLFDFELEVEPILHVLATKSIEQALMEVLEEEEVAEVQAHREGYMQKRNADLAELQRLVNKDKRLVDERIRRHAQEQKRLVEEHSKEKKRVAAIVAKEFYTQLCESTLVKFKESGHFFDPMVKQVANEFVPSMAEMVAGRLHSTTDARKHVERLLSDAITQGQDELAELARQKAEAAAKLAAELQARAEEEARVAQEKEQARLAVEAAAKAEAEAAAAASDSADAAPADAGADDAAPSD